MINFHCVKCRNSFQAEHFNLLRITIECPICATHNNISQSLARVYGKVAGDSIRKIIESLDKLAAKSKENIGNLVAVAYTRVEQICGGGLQ